MLTMTDHLPWDDGEDEHHLRLLQDKMNTYIAFIEGGQYLEEYPDLHNPDVTITVIGKYPLNKLAEKFYHIASRFVVEAEFRLTFELSNAPE